MKLTVLHQSAIRGASFCPGSIFSRVSCLMNYNWGKILTLPSVKAP